MPDLPTSLRGTLSEGVVLTSEFDFDTFDMFDTLDMFDTFDFDTLSIRVSFIYVSHIYIYS